MIASSLLVFTDLDGTLLDHENYSFTAALPALEKLKGLQAPVVINSSKTYAEIAALREAIDNHDPFVVENGAVVFVPGGLFPGYEDALNRVMLGRPVEEIRAIIHELRQRHGFNFRGFADFSVNDVMQATGLAENDAIAAQQRMATEPIQWQDSDDRAIIFRQHLEQHDLIVLKGGRFFHVMGRHDKSQAMEWLRSRYQQLVKRKLVTLALGDSENDRKMLEQADFAGVIRKTDGSVLSVAKPSQQIVYSRHPAPLGWREAVEQLIIQHQSGERPNG